MGDLVALCHPRRSRGRQKKMENLEADLSLPKRMFLKQGGTTSTPAEVVVAKFILKLSTNGECLEYPLQKGRRYPEVSIGGAMVKSHRLAWTIFQSAIPTGMLVCHSCDNPKCCNPEHLFIGDDLTNAQDRHRKNRYSTNARGERVSTCKLKSTEVIEIRNRRARGESIRSITKDFRVSRRAIQLIVNRKNWKHIP